MLVSGFFSCSYAKFSTIHITTEFLNAKAGGLGAVVNDIVIAQALRGDKVTVILPMFKNNAGMHAYDFLNPFKSTLKETIKVVTDDSLIEAIVYSYRIPIAISDKFIELRAIMPIGDFSYLTEIKNTSNPYILSDNAVLTALNLWQKKDKRVKEAREKIDHNISELRILDNKIREISDKALLLETENLKLPKSSVIEHIFLSTGLNPQTILERNAKIREAYIEKLYVERERLVIARKKLLLTNIFENWTFEGILYKIANEKAYYISCLAAMVSKNVALNEKIDIIHTHHFGNETKIIKELMHGSGKCPALVKSLHGLNVKLTHLNGREHPIKVGIQNADAIHVVSKGSLYELIKDSSSDLLSYPENEVIDFNKVFVATNGIDCDQFSLTKKWKIAKEKFKIELAPFPSDIEFQKLDVYEQKKYFKFALATILPVLLKQDKLQSSVWAEQFDPKKPMMLFVGRLCKEKAYERLEIAAKVAKESNSNLAIMGFGDTLFELKIKAKYPEVIFLNTMQDQELIGDFLRGGADMCLLTSNQETAGVVLLECCATIIFAGWRQLWLPVS